MKKVFLFVVLAGFGLMSMISGDEGGAPKKVPSVMLKDLDGNTVNTAEVSNDGNPIVISFWATWCKPCILELNTIAENYDDWQEETGMRLVAVTIDDERNKPKVKPFVDGKGWEYEVWYDSNSELRRAMGVNNPPQTFLLNGEGDIVYSHNGFMPGDEEELYDEILKIADIEE
ncbi:MAG: TlpA family protein disulfide reductase [Crocinitomicaceae bacterium]|nr:TlpA family protein disulfide reductase [Crocinitomicaceae bacterium]